jgi:sec-independent protein translocase protein TatA
MDPLFAVLEGLFTPAHLIIVAVVGVLLFGKRLPEMGRVLGRFVTSFRDGMRGLEDDLHAPLIPQQATAPDVIRPPQRVNTTAPKFEINQQANSAQPQV